VTIVGKNTICIMSIIHDTKKTCVCKEILKRLFLFLILRSVEPVENIPKLKVVFTISPTKDDWDLLSSKLSKKCKMVSLNLLRSKSPCKKLQEKCNSFGQFCSPILARITNIIRVIQ